MKIIGLAGWQEHHRPSGAGINCRAIDKHDGKNDTMVGRCRKRRRRIKS